MAPTKLPDIYDRTAEASVRVEGVGAEMQKLNEQDRKGESLRYARQRDVMRTLSIFCPAKRLTGAE